MLYKNTSISKHFFVLKSQTIKPFVLFLLLTILSCLMGCKNDNNNTKITNNLKSTAAETTASAKQITQKKQIKKKTVSLPVKNPKVILSLHGSNTIGQNLAPELASQFLNILGADSHVKVKGSKENEMVIQAYLPKLDQVVGIEIKAHGSSTAFEGFEKEESDIGMSSRPVKEEEKLRLMVKFGDLSLPKNEHVVGLDGLAIITHPENPVKALDVETIAHIFSGKITNWSQLNGPNKPIKLYSRDDKSGTYDTFKSLVLKPYGSKLSSASKRFESNTKLSEQVSKDTAAIGFTGLAYVGNNHIVSISASRGSQPFKPNAFIVNTEDYPLARRLFLYNSTKHNKNPYVDQFIEFSLSKAGQDIVEAEAFIPQKIFAIEPQISNHAPEKYQVLTNDLSRLSLNFRFKPESSQLDTKAQRDLDRLADYLMNNTFSKIVIVGFSDNIGEEQDNEIRSLRRASMIAYALRERGVRADTIEGLGTSMPIALDTTKQGREKNSRTEIWVKPLKNKQLTSS